MTAATSFDVPSPFAVKLEKDEDPDDEDENDDDNCDDAVSVSSLAQPSILDKDCFNQADPSDEFLRLTSMVRRVYFSYLHKSVISNYNVCCQPKEKGVSKSELKKFAGQMELCAVKASLEASLYRQTMLKMIADIKSNTSRNKVHKKLTTFLETPPCKVDIAVQTTEDYPCKPAAADSSYASKDVHIQSAFVTSNFDENSLAESKREPKDLDKRISDLLKVERRLSPEPAEEKIRVRAVQNKKKIRVKVEKPKKPEIERKRETRPSVVEVTPENSGAPDIHRVENQRHENQRVENQRDENQRVENQLDHEMRDIFGDHQESTNPEALRNGDDEASQDSLMQHLEDMFCESDDSSDLMTLIEKHSGVSKANLDSEIGRMCAADPPPVAGRSVQQQPQQPQISGQRRNVEKPEENPGENATTKRKLSFSNYKRMKKRAMGEPETPPQEETAEDRQARKTRGIWFVERVHQVTKLRTRMMELSVRNNRKHGRLRRKFVELFGDEDEDEETTPGSPIHIEEHLTACKERIAPWVVKCLMPFYTKRVIKDRLLFKTLAKHIADMLIIEKTFPEEEDVGAYIKDYFRNKTSIKAESDIYI